jgi:hypothetical protein
MTLKLTGKRLAALVAALMLVISLSLANLNATSGHQEQTGFPVLERGAAPLQSSIRLKAVTALSLADGSFNAEGVLRLSWPGALQQQLEATGTQVDGLLDFGNRIDNNDFRWNPLRLKPLRAGDGSYSQEFAFSGAFHLGEQDYASFPFIRLGLPLQLELKTMDASSGAPAIGIRQGQLQPPTTAANREVVGYQLKTLAWSQRSGQLMRSVTAVAAYTPSFWPAFCIYLIPWGAVFTLLLIAPWLDTDFDNSRLAVPASALLALVFIQDGIHTALPNLNYLTLIDKLYMFAYCCAVVEFLVFTLSQNYVNRNKEGVDPVRKRNVRAIDTAFQLSSLLGALMILVLDSSLH